MNLAVIDFVFIGIIILFAMHCAVKGFVSEVMSLAAMTLGILSAIFFFRAGADFIRDKFMPEIKTLPEALAFIIIFLTVFAAVKLVEVMLKTIINGIRLGTLNRILGFIFGVAEGIVVICLLLFLINVLSFIDQNRILAGSFFAEWLMPFITGTQKEFSNMIAGGIPSIRMELCLKI